ncbi:hypothetical protein D210916BOD24_01260 [Alteromonas sp. D210916BOD_24]|uniref:tetratricopeptide repeat protein n=1 Tax=Alteromonas sp. D210916BOD_24 TaxID=3157618 RepID=UPI00399CA6D1
MSLLGLVLTFAVYADDSADNANYEAAVLSYQNKAYKDAFIHVKNVLQNNPDYLPAHILLGALYFDNGLMEKADETYQSAFEQGTDPNLIFHNWSRVLLRLRESERLLLIDYDGKLQNDVLIEWLAARANACLLEGRNLCAKREYEAILSRSPNHPKGLNGLALLAIDESRFDEAQRLMDISFQIDSNQADTLWVKGKLEKARGQLTAAQRFFNQAFILAPSDAKIARSLIDAYVAAADLDAALLITEDLLLETEDDLYVMFVNSWLTSQIDALSNIRPQLELISQRLSNVPEEVMIGEPSLFYLRGMVALMQSNFEQARDNFTAFNVYAETDLQTSILLATTNMALGDKKAAMLELQNHQDKLIEENLQQAILLGSLYLESKRNFKAVNLLEKLQARYGHSIEVALFSIRVDFSRGKFKQAADQLDALLDIHPDSRQVLLAYALYFLDVGDTQKATFAITRLMQQFPEDVAVKNMQAAQLLIEKRFEEAENILNKVLAESPNLFAARYNQATLLVNQGRTDQAKAILESLEMEKNNHFQVVYQLATINMLEGNVELAIARYNMLLQRYGANTKTTFAAVAAFNQIGDYRSAIAALRKLEVKEPGNGLALVQLATFYIKMADNERAKSTLLKLELLFDRPANILVSESMNWLALGNEDKAFYSMQQAHLMQPDNVNLQLQWVKLLLALNKLALAQENLSKLSDQFPANPYVLFKFGELAQLNRDELKAIAFYEQVLDEDPNFDLAYAKLYAISAARGDFTALLARLNQAVTQQPRRYFSRNLLAQYHFYYGDSEQAILHYTTLINEAPESARYAILNRLAILHLKTSPVKSEQYAAQAYALNPADADVLHIYGWALTINGKADTALPLIREASVRNATSLSLQYHLAYTLAAIGNSSEAKRILTKIVNATETFAQQNDARVLLSELEGST